MLFLKWASNSDSFLKNVVHLQELLDFLSVLVCDAKETTSVTDSGLPNKSWSQEAPTEKPPLTKTISASRQTKSGPWLRNVFKLKRSDHNTINLGCRAVCVCQDLSGHWSGRAEKPQTENVTTGALQIISSDGTRDLRAVATRTRKAANFWAHFSETAWKDRIRQRNWSGACMGRWVEMQLYLRLLVVQKWTDMFATDSVSRKFELSVWTAEV